VIMTAWDVEERALAGDADSVLQVVQALRKYRRAVTDLLGKRYRDGECDSVALSGFESEVDEIEENLVKGE
jgi:hypothetical protein